MTALCVTCGHPTPLTHDGKCRECESHKLDVLLRAYEAAIARLEAHTKIVVTDFRGQKPSERSEIGI